MKTYIISFLAITILMTGCHTGHHHDHDHDHAGHDHNHSDGHIHGTSTDTEGVHTDEIVFTREQAEAIGLQIETV